jgi:hypothetical protein
VALPTSLLVPSKFFRNHSVTTESFSLLIKMISFTDYDSYLEYMAHWQEILLDLADHVRNTNDIGFRTYYRDQLTVKFAEFITGLNDLERQIEEAYNLDNAINASLQPADTYLNVTYSGINMSPVRAIPEDFNSLPVHGSEENPINLSLEHSEEDSEDGYSEDESVELTQDQLRDIIARNADLRNNLAQRVREYIQGQRSETQDAVVMEETMEDDDPDFYDEDDENAAMEQHEIDALHILVQGFEEADDNSGLIPINLNVIFEDDDSTVDATYHDNEGNELLQ